MKRLHLLLISLLMVFFSCGAPSEEGEETEKEIVALRITPLTVSVKKFNETTFKAIATYDDGSTGTITSDAAWSSDNPEIATITSGTATGVTEGNTTICASYESIDCDQCADLTVTPAVVDINIINQYNRAVVFEVWKGSELEYQNSYVLGYGEKAFPSTTTPSSIAQDSSTDVQFSYEQKIDKVLIVMGVAYLGEYYYVVDNGFYELEPSLNVVLCSDGNLIDASSDSCN